MLFNATPEDEPLFAPRTADSGSPGFSYMLGEVGEEFIYEEVSPGTEQDMADSAAFFEDADFDVDLVLAQFEGVDSQAPLHGDAVLDGEIPPVIPVDLDILFDALNIGADAPMDASMPLGSADAASGPPAGAADPAGMEAVFSFEPLDPGVDRLFDHIAAGDQS